MPESRRAVKRDGPGPDRLKCGMLDLSLFVCASALFDSVSTTQQIVILILLFSTEKPVRNSLGFILGISLAYLLSGLVGLLLVDRLNDMVKLFMPNLDAFSNPNYYQTQSIVGAVLTVSGPLYWFFKKRSKRPPMENQLLARLKRMNFWVAFGLGAVLSATSFPAALPYVASLQKIAASGLAPGGQAGFVLLYNAVYALPLVVPFFLFVFLKEGIVKALHHHVQRLNLILTIVMLSGMGLFLIADSLAFFWGGKPLLSSRFL